MNENLLNVLTEEKRSIYSITVRGDEFKVARAPIFHDEKGSLVVEPLYEYAYVPSLEVVSSLHDDGCVVYCNQVLDVLNRIICRYDKTILLPSKGMILEGESDEEIRNLPENVLGARMEKGKGDKKEYVLYWKGGESHERSRIQSKDSRLGTWIDYNLLPNTRILNPDRPDYPDYDCTRLENCDVITDETFAMRILKEWVSSMIEKGFLKSIAGYQFTLKLEQNDVKFVAKASLF